MKRGRPDDRRQSLRAARPTRSAVTIAVFGTLATLAGCSGSAKLTFVSLNAGAIDPPPPDTYEYAPQKCFYAIDDHNRLVIAMQFENISLVGPLGRVTLQASFVLDSPPPGRGRDYRVGTNEVRARLRSAVDEHRFLAYAGIISVVRNTDHSLRGSLRLWLRHYPSLNIFSLMPQRTDNLLLFGRFHAVHHPAEAERIRRDTESAGWVRRPATTAPATQPASRPS